MVDLPIKVMLKVSILPYKYILTLHVQHIDVQAKQQIYTTPVFTEDRILQNNFLE